MINNSFCIECLLPKEGNSKFCKACINKHRRLADNKMKKQCLQDKICYICKNPLDRDGQKCIKCNLKQYKRLNKRLKEFNQIRVVKGE